jgi:PAS fold
MDARGSKDRLHLAEAAGGIATFELNVDAGVWVWSPQATLLFGRDPQLGTWEQIVFVDDVPKIHAAVLAAAQTGSFYVEFRVRRPDGSVHWVAGKGQVSRSKSGHAPVLRGALYDITDRKALEARLLALNETLEARVAEVRDEARTLEIVNRTGVAVAAEHDLERLVQIVTDAGVELCHAQFGAFFHNVLREDGEAYTLCALSGASRDSFAQTRPNRVPPLALTLETLGG